MKSLIEGEKSKFYMECYLLDDVCAKCDFEGLGCKWSLEEELYVHIYFKDLWNMRYRGMCEKIVKYFIYPL